MSEKHYEVGYGKPPHAHKFKKGTSGNPKGRKKESIPTLAAMVHDIWMEKIVITEHGVERKVTAFDLIVRQLVTKAITGDARTATRVFRKYGRYARGTAPLAFDQRPGMTVLESLQYYAENYPEHFKSTPRPLPIRPPRKRGKNLTPHDIFHNVVHSSITMQNGAKVSRIRQLLRRLVANSIRGDLESAEALVDLRNYSVRYRILSP